MTSQAQQSRHYRVPSPPRILVPPPALNSNGVPDLQISQNASFDFESMGFENHDFLEKVTYGNFMTANAMLEWKYAQRRVAQSILPFLFLGPMGIAKDREYLQREGFTMVMAVRNTMSAQAKLLGSRAAKELGLETSSLDVAGNQELIAAFPRGIEAINAHLSLMYKQHQAKNSSGQQSSPSPGRVLVYCESGNERSAALVAAYLMAMYAFDLVKAIQVLQAQRFAVAFDDSLRNLLLTYESILRAKRDVLQHGSIVTAVKTTPERAKRRLDDAYDNDDDDDDVDMDQFGGVMDSGRFERRQGHAPFQDTSDL